MVSRVATVLLVAACLRAAVALPVTGELPLSNAGPTQYAAMSRSAGLPNGDMVVVWKVGADVTLTRGIFGKVVNAAGTVLGSFTAVTEGAGETVEFPDVAALPNGNIVVTWALRTGTAYSMTDVLAAVFVPSGASFTMSGQPFHVSAFLPNEQRSARVVPLQSGSSEFVVVWVSRSVPPNTNPADPSGYGIFCRRFNSAGQPLSGDVVVPSATGGDQTNADVASFPTGGFVVVWENLAPTKSVNARVFDAAAVPVGAQVVVEGGVSGPDAAAPSVAVLKNGGFAVAFMYDTNIYAKLYSPAGSALSSRFQVNTHTPLAQFYPTTCPLANGGFIVAWNSPGQDEPAQPNLHGVYAREFKSTGPPNTAEFRVNVVVASTQYEVHCAAVVGQNKYVATWTDYSSLPSTIMIRVFSTVAPPSRPAKKELPHEKFP